MQSSSHLTRVYFVNADFLEGFLLERPYVPEVAAFTVKARYKYRLPKYEDADLLADEFLDVLETFKTEMIELKAKN